MNEWACLGKPWRKFSLLICLFGNDFPFGGYLPCGPINLDIGVAWFRDMHSHGFHARHFDMHGYIKHWVGTGNNTPHKYAINENNALLIFKTKFQGLPLNGWRARQELIFHNSNVLFIYAIMHQDDFSSSFREDPRLLFNHSKKFFSFNIQVFNVFCIINHIVTGRHFLFSFHCQFSMETILSSDQPPIIFNPFPT